MAYRKTMIIINISPVKIKNPFVVIYRATH